LGGLTGFDLAWFGCVNTAYCSVWPALANRSLLRIYWHRYASDFQTSEFTGLLAQRCETERASGTQASGIVEFFGEGNPALSVTEWATMQT
jgi:hypothetical protein